MELTPAEQQAMYSSQTCIGVVENLKTPALALTQVFANRRPMPTDAGSPQVSEEVFLDYRHPVTKPAKFVDPEGDAEVVEERGRSLEKFRPGYTMEKTAISNDAPFQRAAGEGVGATTYSPLQRRMMCVADATEQLSLRVEILIETLVRDLLIDGKYEVSGDKYGDREIDVKRHADLSITLTGNDRWTVDGVVPGDALSTGQQRIVKLGGSRMMATHVVMNSATYRTFIKNDDVREQLDNRRLMGSSIQSGTEGRGLFHKGIYENWNIYEHQDYYTDEGGALVPFIPDNKVVMLVNEDLGGSVHWGAIKSAHWPAGFAGGMTMYAMRTYTPSAENRQYVEVHSAPAPFFARADASCVITVA